MFLFLYIQSIDFWVVRFSPDQQSFRLDLPLRILLSVISGKQKEIPTKVHPYVPKVPCWGPFFVFSRYFLLLLGWSAGAIPSLYKIKFTYNRNMHRTTPGQKRVDNDITNDVGYQFLQAGRKRIYTKWPPPIQGSAGRGKKKVMFVLYPNRSHQ